MPPEVSTSNTAILENITQENIFRFRIFLINSLIFLLKLVFHKICHSVIKI